MPEEELPTLGRGLMKLGYTPTEARERPERVAHELPFPAETCPQSRIVIEALPV